MSLTIANKQQIIAKLEEVHSRVKQQDYFLSEQAKATINTFSAKIPVATSAFSNIVTCLVCRACDSSIDPRYHRKPSAEMPEPPTGKDNWFSGRSISERVIYPWLTAKGYRTAKSGWQTRTFERPRPYTLDYPENIAHVKDEFLSILNMVTLDQESAKNVLIYFFVLEEVVKQEKSILMNQLAKQNLSNNVPILDIIGALQTHFSLRNSARLPVIAIFAVYKLLLKDVRSYQNRQLQPLSAHEASDLRTGAIGDIELTDTDGVVIEALEIKHRIQIDLAMLLRAEEKILSSQVARYYILTTHANCIVNDDVLESIIKRVYQKHGCQIIVNGVLPTIKYYLRLITSPEAFLAEYTQLLASDRATRSIHLQAWKEILENL